ncbi:MAG: DUF4333 domain-containing protein [Nodosilinea sp.]
MTARVWLGLVLLSTMALNACSNRLDMSRVEKSIQSDIERQGRRFTLKEVRCPDQVNRQEGAYFRCVGEIDPKGSFTINVTQRDKQGNVSWDIPNSKALLNLAKVETSIQEGVAKALGRQAAVDCGSATYRINQPGDRFECQIVGGITVGPDTINAVLVTVDASGNLDWQEITPPKITAALPPNSASAPVAAPGTVVSPAPALQKGNVPKKAPAVLGSSD